MQVQVIKCMDLLISPAVLGIEINLPFKPLSCNLIILAYLKQPNFCQTLLIDPRT